MQPDKDLQMSIYCSCRAPGQIHKHGDRKDKIKKIKMNTTPVDLQVCLFRLNDISATTIVIVTKTISYFNLVPHINTYI